MKRIQLIGIALILVISISMVAYASKNEEGITQAGKFCVEFTDLLYQEFGIEVDQQECVVCRNNGLDSYPVCQCKMWEQQYWFDLVFKNFGECVQGVTRVMH